MTVPIDRYRDEHGRWRSTTGISLRELPKAVLALQKAFEQLTVHIRVRQCLLRPVLLLLSSCSMQRLDVLC